VIKLNGAVIDQIQLDAAADGTTTRTETFSAPITGVHQVITTSNGQTLTLLVDGRQTVPVPVGTDPKTIRFADGQAVPQLTIPPAIADAMTQLFNDAGSAMTTCLASSGSDTLAFSDPRSGNGGVSGSQCTGCEIACDGALAGCSAGAVAAAIACGPFAVFCGAGVGLACIGAYEGCNALCHRSGTDCCPVACGGESGITTPIGGCCFAGDSCARRATDAHVALCCGSGTTACGGTQCCLPGDKCFTFSSGGICCPPEDQKPDGTCCFQGSCTTRADCNGGDPNGNNGCVNGCCVIG
jgi:hypothetical protein